MKLRDRFKSNAAKRDEPQGEIAPLTAGEREWVERNLHLAQELLAELSPVERGAALTPEVLDRLYIYWWARRAQMEIDPNHAINAVGIAFGQYLVDTHGLRWVTVMHGSSGEIAVHGEQGDLLLFPPNLVAKRFEQGETNFLKPIARAVEDAVRLIQRA